MIRRVYIPKANGKLPPDWHHHDRRSSGAKGGGVGTQRSLRAGLSGLLARVPPEAQPAHGAAPSPRRDVAALGAVRCGGWTWSSYFDTVNWDVARKFVRHRVNDGGLIRLLNKWLKAGVMENGVVTLSDEGVPQGGPVSPVLSNIYLHYVLDLWFERRFKKTCRGYAELTRFADDFVAAFRNHEDAERFRQEMEERLAAFGLRVAPEKTALLHFDGSLLQGSRATGEEAGHLHLPWLHPLPDEDASRHDHHRPHTERQSARALCTQGDGRGSRRTGTSPSRAQQAHLTKMLNGYYQYFGLRLLHARLSGVRQRVQKLWRWALQRRSQKAKRRH